MDSQKIKQLILKGIKAMVKPILTISIIAIILVSLFFGVIDGMITTAAKIFNGIVDNINIEGKNLVIDEQYMSDAKEQLERNGINSSTLGLGNNEEYLDRFLEAEIVTNFPYLGGDGLQGAVYFERRNPDGSTKQLEYISYDEFYNKVDNGEGLTDYFTVDQEDWTVHIVKIDGNIEKINYKNMVEKFAMPFEFPIALAMTSQNPQFALAVVNLVKDSRITITIAESSTTTTTTVTEHYDQKVERRILREEGKGSTTEIISESKEQGRPRVTTDVTYSTEIFLSSARTWILNVVTDLQYDNSNEDLEPVEEMINPVIVTDKEEQGDGTVIITTKSNRKNVTETHIEYKRWIKGTSKVIEKTDNFINLIIRKKSANGQGLLKIAEECHNAIAESGRFSYGATVGGIPIDVNTDTKVDCSGYVSWVLYEAGYKDLEGAQHSTADDSFGAYGDSKGWERIQNIEDIQPGDICFWKKNGSPWHVNIFVSKESGRYLFWDCGWDGAISSLEPVQWAQTDQFYYAFRPNDEIAKALNPQTEQQLEKQIEDYIKNTREGKYSVSVVNLDKNIDNININNEKVKSNGLIKLFVMATVYNEVNKGKIEEQEITGELSSMITTDNNSSTNNLLKILGNGDISEGINIVNDYIRKNSYRDTKIAVELEKDRLTDGHDETYTSVKDVASLLKKIYNKTCINSVYSEKMMNLLNGQTITEMIPSTISGAQIASKSGEQNEIAQDAAIISTENANYLLVISASDLSSTEIGKENIRQIANIVNVHYAENGTLSHNENLQNDNEIEIKMNGDRVCYRLPSGQFQCPLENLVESSEMLFELLGKFEKTQNHERLMRYLLYLLTGDDYGVTEFDFYEFLGIQLISAGGGDYVVDTTQSPEEIVITDLETLKKAFSWYSNDQVLQQYAQYFLECQEKYHVNAIFAAAVSITESGAGTNIAIGGNNMFSISNGGAGNWNSYATMEASIESFFKLISGEYFTNGQYTVSQISNGSNHSYCVPGEPWVTNTTNYMTQMFNAAGIDTSSVTNGNTGPATDMQNKIVQLASSKNTFGKGAGWCQAWVAEVYSRAGQPWQSAPCASEAANKWVISKDKNNIPLGACVYGHSYIRSNGTQAMCNGHEAGHVGIYIGNGQIASNVGGILICSLDYWESNYGWKGWGWNAGIDYSK